MRTATREQQHFRRDADHRVEVQMYSTKIVLAITCATAAAAAGACRTQAKLTPAPGAAVVSGRGRGAEAVAAGVRVVARAGAWQWEPRDLETKATPILIELENNGQFDMLVRYNHIALTDEAGHRFAAMPPYDVDATINEASTVRNPYYGFNRFYVAPYLRRWYPGFSMYDGTFAYEGSYYSPFITRYRSVKLPTADMVQRALPEGVLEAGGRAQGFVYFEALDRDAGMLTLSVDIIDAHSGAVAGTARIPFRAH
jgi:hypothetical protein